MLYFILWVLFLLFVVLAIPVTSMLEKRKYQASRADQLVDEPVAEGLGEEVAENPLVESAPDDFGGDGGQEAGDEFGGFGEIPEAVGGDDFSAFDEEFK